MVSITRKNVNDRISNRVDNIARGFAVELLQSQPGMRCYLHQVCFALGRGIDHICASMSGSMSGSKRYASEPTPTSATTPQTWQWSTTRTARFGRSTGLAQLAG